MSDKLDKLKKWIGASKKTVFFGGAGVSTESGIPDFRSKDGLYNRRDVRFDAYRPEYLLSSDCLPGSLLCSLLYRVFFPRSVFRAIGLCPAFLFIV